jgi:hypothetical protein
MYIHITISMHILGKFSIDQNTSNNDMYSISSSNTFNSYKEDKKEIKRNSCLKIFDLIGAEVGVILFIYLINKIGQVYINKYVYVY